jgi:glutamate racemase
MLLSWRAPSHRAAPGDEQAIKALVIACNTATAAAIDLLRASTLTLPIIGVEPALKPAARSAAPAASA